MNGARAGMRTAALGAAVGAAMVPSGTAHALLDVGDAAVGNVCHDLGLGARAEGRTVASPGVATADVAQLPVHLPLNDCAGGLVCY
ncbi:chaplin family protein [Streptomyces sp. UH6]|uniref:chaplin family protein n=1 Tax=Streptomyces sp. UH6 TaxID=2748379 RepID=UPI0015D501E7|nr:chaplin family protein [Streptomyces sp. UH6]NYV77665.1 chaplin [Streptomyces sp. UH6]